MEKLHILVSIQIIFFVVYVGWLWFKFKSVPSISSSWYLLPSQSKFAFICFVWVIALTLFLWGDILLFFAGVSLVFTGSAVDYKGSTLTQYVHNGTVLISVSLIMIYFIINNLWFIPVIWIIGFVFILLFTKTNTRIWWAELFSFLCIIIGLICIL